VIQVIDFNDAKLAINLIGCEAELPLDLIDRRGALWAGEFHHDFSHFSPVQMRHAGPEGPAL